LPVEDYWNYENLVGKKKPLNANADVESPDPGPTIQEPPVEPPETQPSEEQTPSAEDLLMILAAKSDEADELREQLEQMGVETGRILKATQDEAVMRNAQATYQHDPMAATFMLVEHAKKEILETVLDAVESRIDEVMANERNFERFLGEFLRAPGNEYLQPYEHEIEYLVLEKGMAPHEAAEMIRTIESRGMANSQRRAAAAQQIRDASMVESGGDVSSTMGPDADLDRVLKKAKTVDEMFQGLNKLRV
jgi:hypothetical protein